VGGVVFLWVVFLWVVFLWVVFLWVVFLWVVFLWVVFLWVVFLWVVFLWVQYCYNIVQHSILPRQFNTFRLFFGHTFQSIGPNNIGPAHLGKQTQ
jgi:hypothetical protein